MTGRTASPDDIEMSSVLSALKRGFPKTLLMSLLLGGLTYGVLTMMAPKYQSQAEMTIEAKGQPLSDPKSTTSPEAVTTKMDKEAINTHVRALQSPTLISKIAEEMNLKEKREFNSKIGSVDFADTLMRLIGMGGPRPGESERDRVLGALYKQIEVYAAKESRFIGIRASSSDPVLAADIANKIAETYRETLKSAGVSEIDDQQNVLSGKIDKLKPEVAEAETVVQRYRGEFDLFVGGAQGGGLKEQQLSELTGELTRAKATRSEAEARAKSAREMMKLGSADALPDVQKSPLIQNLVQQRVRIERQISELSATLLPAHPRMRQLNADLAGLMKQLNGEIAKLVDSLDKEAKVALGREESIKKSLDELKAKVVTNAPEKAKLDQLEANAKAKKTELENLQAQLEANKKKLDARAQPVEARIVTKAEPASVPEFPKKKQNAALVTFASLLLGTFWSITRALFSGARSRDNPMPIEPKLSSQTVSVRAEPELTSKTGAAKVPASTAPAATLEADDEYSVESVVRRLKGAAPKEGGHRTIVTGDAGPVNASQEAMDIASEMSRLGDHVILIDWSPSGNGMQALAGTSASPGMTELLLGETGFEEAVQRLPQTNVHFIGCGAPLDAGGIDADQVNLVLDALDEAYDYIIVAGQHEDARQLFETIQGRFDAGVIVSEGKKRTSVLQDPPGTFLGFEVSGIDVIRLERKAAQAAVSQRILRATQKSRGEARSV